MRKYWPLTRPSPVSARHCAAFVIAALVAALVAAMPAQARLLPQPPAAAPPPLGTDANDTGDQGKDKKVKVRKIKKKDGAETNSFGSYTGKVTGTGDILSRYETLGMDMGGAAAFGDNIDIDMGMLSLSHVDVSVPGNSALPVELRRELARSTPTSGRMPGFSNWSPVVPLITQEYLYVNGPQANRCSGPGFGGPEITRINLPVTNPESPPYVDIYKHEFYNGFTMVGPSGDKKALLLNYGSAEFTGAGSNARYVTRDNWLIHCIPLIGGGGEGFQATGPDGTKYTFNLRVLSGQRDMKVWKDGYFGEEVFTWVMGEAFLLTRVDDVNGNWVQYEYSGSNLTRIHANDGREITLAWSGDRIVGVSSHGRSWTYSYGGYGELSQVTLPDGGYWSFGFLDLREPGHPDPAQCGYTVPGPFTVRHPAGATATYSFAEIINGRFQANWPFPSFDWHDWMGFECIDYPAAVRSLAVTTKQVSLPGGGSSIWAWEYEQDAGRFADIGSTPVPSNLQPSPPATGPLKARTLTQPDGSKVVTYVNRQFNHREGDIDRVDILAADNTVLQSEQFQRAFGHAVGYSTSYGASPSQSRANYLNTSTLNRGGDVYTTSYTYQTNAAASDYAYGAPSLVSKSSSLGGGVRTTAKTYTHRTTPWVLALPASVTENNTLIDTVTYDGLGRATQMNRFGSLFAAYGYHTAAGQAGLLAYEDNALLQRTSYNNYKRGIAQSVTRRDGLTITGAVNDNGWITSATNARNFTTSFQYNGLGRVTYVGRPGGVAPTSISYTYVANGLRRVAATGAMSVTTDFDGLLQPHLVARAGSGLSTIYTKKTWDGMSRVTFESWPSFSSNPSTGVVTSYDALDRVTRREENVAPTATTTFAYLSQNRTRVTDPALAQTTTRFSGYGAPDDGAAIESIDAMGAVTTITRDLFGNVVTLNQSGTQNGYATNVARQFWYDGRLRLCRHRAPEFGDELFAYDALDRLSMSSRGEAAASGCATPSAGIRSALTYDLLDRVTATDFAGTTPDAAMSYDGEGNLLSASRAGGAVWTYAYNPLNAISQEKLVIDARTYQFDYVYDGQGSLYSRSGPGGTLSLTPDAFGRPTGISAAATPYFSGLSYHPNGMAATGVYANGKHFWQSLNSRMQPGAIAAYTPGGSYATLLTYGYDARGKVNSIIDGVVAGENRTFGYDPNGRLTSSTGAWGSGTYVYDALGNVRQRNEGTAGSSTISYDSTNRVSQSVVTGLGTRAYVYDARGNTLGVGGQGFTYDFSNQPVSLYGNVAASYSYDANMKRVKEVRSAKTIYTIY
ncbi:MAG: hypothetical protein ABL957_14720, partial [Parvularculaceae bacterium]